MSRLSYRAVGVYFAAVAESLARSGRSARLPHLLLVGRQVLLQLHHLLGVHAPIAFNEPGHLRIVFSQLRPDERIDVVHGEIGFRAFGPVFHAIGAGVMGTGPAVPYLDLLVLPLFHHALVVGLAFLVAVVAALADEVIVIAVRQFVKDDKRVAIAVPNVGLDAERHERLRVPWNRVAAADQPGPFRVIRQVHLLLVLDPDGVVFLHVAHRQGRGGQLDLVEFPPQMLQRFGRLFGVLPGHVAIDVNGPAFQVADLKAVFSARLPGRFFGLGILGLGLRAQQAGD